jgi:hypothetical protein
MGHEIDLLSVTVAAVEWLSAAQPDPTADQPRR